MRGEWQIGATPLESGRWSFRVWAPQASRVDLHLVTPHDRVVAMQRLERGYWHVVLDGLEGGARYLYRIEDKGEFPDPASKSQPDGVHGSSALVDSKFAWHDQGWFGVPLRDYIIYELHVGTFTRDGTFESIIPYLERLKELGITALELMPVAQFPGNRNWGYDGVYLFAVQSSYGGPEGLKRLVDACHQLGLAVILDVVYNHLGPEGNYLREFGPYFNESYKTLWGAAINFDGPESDEVRQFFLENALYWQRELHLDALRLDAVHAIRDFSATPFLEELAKVTQREAERMNRRFYLIAESDLNNPRLITPPVLGGWGLDAQWSDDFHHCLHTLVTGERAGYYQDFSGGTRQLAKVFRDGYGFTGQYSQHRKRKHGAWPQTRSSRQFVVCAQNHDQVGNRLLGERLTQLTTLEGLKVAAGTVLLSPFIPLLFMGEEYGETAPFQYMTSHSDPELVASVREGRRQEFAEFHIDAPAPDPQAEVTLEQNRLNLDLPERDERHRILQEFYRELIRLRKELPALVDADRDTVDVQAFETKGVLCLHYRTVDDEVLVLLRFGDQPSGVTLEIPLGIWSKLLDSASRHWLGPGSSVPGKLSGSEPVTLELAPKSVTVFRRVQPSR